MARICQQVGTWGGGQTTTINFVLSVFAVVPMFFYCKYRANFVSLGNKKNN